MSDLHRQIVEHATIHAERIEDVKRDELGKILREWSFARVTGLIKPEAIDEARKKLEAWFRVDNDRATTGEHHTEVRDNFQKMSIGRARHGTVDRPRFMRCFYNPLTADDIFGMRESFRKVAQIRNLLAERPLDYAIDKVEDGMWTASRIHLFPTGGGFMVSHKDTVLPALYQRENIGEYFQPLLLLSQKGVDFETGGGFAEVRGERVIYEDVASKGDIVIYDTSTVHGVEDIDPHEPYRQSSMNGRMSGLVTLYKSL